jgi:hypothetical protein
MAQQRSVTDQQVAARLALGDQIEAIALQAQIAEGISGRIDNAIAWQEVYTSTIAGIQASIQALQATVANHESRIAALESP